MPPTLPVLKGLSVRTTIMANSRESHITATNHGIGRAHKCLLASDRSGSLKNRLSFSYTESNNKNKSIVISIKSQSMMKRYLYSPSSHKMDDWVNFLLRHDIGSLLSVEVLDDHLCPVSKYLN